MKTVTEIKARLSEIVKLIVEDDAEFDDDSLLMDDIGINSIMMLSLFSLIEEEYGIRFNPKDYYKIETFGDLTSYVFENQKG